MNTFVSKYVPNTKYYSTSISLEDRLKTAVDIYNCGYQFFLDWGYEGIGEKVQGYSQEHRIWVVDGLQKS